MVLRCSLLGHEYGEPHVDRDREERGSEVVVTVQEYEECSRCGDRHVISENTEVTRLATADAESDADTADGGADTAGVEDGAPDAVADGSDAVTETERPPSTPDPSDAVDDETLASADDPPAREHGEWPDSSDVGPPVGADADPAAWPDDDGDDGTEADPAGEELSFSEPAEVSAADADGPEEDDGIILEDSSGSSGAPAGSGIDAAASDDADATPDDIVDASETPPAADRDAPLSNADEDASITGIESAGAAPAPGQGGPADGVATEFFCPRCEFRADGDRGSLRTGDICPDCRKGYLSEREYEPGR
ncbi:hypothetical protein OB905_09280 [Halobacteria archaeon AArc-dxtr1]|nr:hypothetical protein [Halobacteria archaeon AArc-dxtr1]